MLIPKGNMEKRRIALIRQFLITKQLLRSDNHSQLSLAPITTLPTRFPKRLFLDGESATPIFHKLIDSMTTDIEGLLKMYSKIRDDDEFVNAFCCIVEKVYLSGKKSVSNCIRAYVTRNDFLLDQSSGELKMAQVEINLSSVVGPHSMEELTELHKMLVIPEYRSKLPGNKPRTLLIDNLRTLDDVYKARFGDGQRQCILWVLGKFEANFPEILHCVSCLRDVVRASELGRDGERSDSSGRVETEGGGENISSRTTVETAAVEGNNTRVFVVAWDDLANALSNLKFENQRFYFNPALFVYNEEDYLFEVSTVYFRTGYRPDHYHTQNHWLLREFIEASECAVIPSAVSQLVGLKKAQQVWSSKQTFVGAENERPALERYLPNKQQRDHITNMFVDQVDVSDEDPHTLRIIQDALKNPQHYVLKPQREGGGNNIYGDQIPLALPPLLENKTASHILMTKIDSPETLTEIYVDDVLSIKSCVSEIGFYGVGIWNGNKQVVNENIGYLLRTKKADSDEGGISIKAAVFDSVMLV
ncbi:glutathione synthase [Gregarina niphandrodes]|uniref:Glutathione synthetase n=1 Tax=Gregarina niphandrodes TaxID=110365 RepID=A0A023BAS2_GRENI|nr:glutathione synthase [Gregarina niphandrodes]EZG78535.1 glutathione synthase [Gregarina niphandrodes]|eukprot:XP_011129265.1 glutathione synthase [Gregarina niphandrodes]